VEPSHAPGEYDDHSLAPSDRTLLLVTPGELRYNWAEGDVQPFLEDANITMAKTTITTNLITTNLTYSHRIT